MVMLGRKGDDAFGWIAHAGEGGRDGEDVKALSFDSTCSNAAGLRGDRLGGRCRVTPSRPHDFRIASAIRSH